MKPIQRIRARRATAFTLLEVLLAISIALGLFVVALHFYQHAADLRTQLIDESERLSAIRQVMDRVTADLRGGFAPSSQGFSGDSNSLCFVTTHFPSRLAWRSTAADPGSIRETDLKLVRYGLTRTTEGTNDNVSGFIRVEQMLTELNSVPAATALTNNPGSKTSATNFVAEPITDAIRFVRFRYWDGITWTDSWAGTALPLGVEVTLGTETLKDGEDPDDYGGEIFRRVIHLPAGISIPGGFGLTRPWTRQSAFAVGSP